MATKRRITELIAKKLNISNQLSIGGAAVTATAAELNVMDGVTSTAAELNILDGATVTVAELNKLDAAPLAVVYVIGSEAANVINVGIQLNDADGVALATRGTVFAYLSDDANGDSITATAPDGGVAIGTDGVAIPVVANKAFQLVSETDGDIDIDITDTGTPTFYLIVVLPTGLLSASGAITFA